MATLHRDLLLHGMCAPERPPIPPSNFSLIFQHFIQKPNFIRRVLGHAANEVGLVRLVLFESNALVFLAADTCSLELMIDGYVVDRYEMIGLEEVQELF